MKLRSPGWSNWLLASGSHCGRQRTERSGLQESGREQNGVAPGPLPLYWIDKDWYLANNKNDISNYNAVHIHKQIRSGEKCRLERSQWWDTVLWLWSNPLFVFPGVFCGFKLKDDQHEIQTDVLDFEFALWRQNCLVATMKMIFQNVYVMFRNSFWITFPVLLRTCVSPNVTLCSFLLNRCGFEIVPIK